MTPLFIGIGWLAMGLFALFIGLSVGPHLPAGAPNGMLVVGVGESAVGGLLIAIGVRHAKGNRR